ncbi:hypothetical protein CA262_08950 [Sphingobium sp. GW456-12-10-14-TSB1]|uniref:hypothetical protein n=1 Tax=Sphingobium sp. GW456-12-10-14-TSB1 TaxID=1987165 RepID=UPI000A370E45|nr:hypothetical protein [Sphingobium sp. GW456-12-10-14-TSB1]OUC54971.1 hypothetical protein CA262_08950 [Sphingobium sp. GW456-12-10-14-TSB1]
MLTTTEQTQRAHKAVGDWRSAVAGARLTRQAMEAHVAAMRTARAALLPFADPDHVPTFEQLAKVHPSEWDGMIADTIEHVKSRMKEQKA